MIDSFNHQSINSCISDIVLNFNGNPRFHCVSGVKSGTSTEDIKRCISTVQGQFHFKKYMYTVGADKKQHCNVGGEEGRHIKKM